MAWTILGVTQFSWLSLIHRGGIYVSKLLFVFLLLICLIMGGSLQPRSWKCRDKIIFLIVGSFDSKFKM